MIIKKINIKIIALISLLSVSCLLIMPDLDPPEVRIISHEPNDIVFEIVEIECEIEDNSTLERAQLWVDYDSTSTEIHINELKEAYSLFWNTTSLEKKLYYIEVKAYDKNGNVGSSGVIPLNVDNDSSVPGASIIDSVELIGTQYKITWKKTDATDFEKYKIQHLYPWIDINHFDIVDVETITNIDDTVYYRSNIDPTIHDNIYRIVVYDTLGFQSNQTPSSQYRVDPDPYPDEIEITNASYDNNSIIINWNQSFENDFLRYELYESYHSDMDDFELIFSTDESSETEFSRIGIYDNETRYYQIAVVDIWNQKTEGPIKTANAFTRFYQTYGGTNDDVGFDVIPIAKEGFIVSGYTESFGSGNEDGFVINLDQEGNEISSYTFGNSDRDKIVNSLILSDSTLMFVGRSESSGNGGSDAWIVHSNRNGGLISERFYGGSGDDGLNAIVENTEGNLAAIGYKSLEDGSKDILLLEMDQIGEMINEFTFGGNDLEYGVDLISRAIGGYVLLGETKSYGAGEVDVWLMQLDSNGEIDWQTTIAGTFSSDYARKILFDQGGGGYFILMKEGGNSPSPVCIVKVDLNGNELWRYNYGYTSSDDAVDMVQSIESSNYLMVFGTTYKNDNGDLWFFKVDVTTGEIDTNTENIFIDGTMDDQGYSIDIVIEDGGYILVGESSSYGSGGKDIVVIKTDPYGNTVGYDSE